MAIKLGLIGFGGMAGWHRKNAIRIPGVEVLAAYDIDPARVQAAKDDGLIGYDTLEGLLADPNVNTVLVATPNDFHCELAVAASKAGKNVISEKPVALNLGQLDQMITAANEAGKIFTVHQNRRWDLDFVTAKKVVDSGALGKIFTIQSRLHGAGGIMHGWRGEKVHGGGMLYDWGIHFLDQICYMLDFNKMKAITCYTNSVVNSEIDDYFNLIIDMEDNVRVQIEIGTYVLKSLPRWFICGDEGTLWIEDFKCSDGGTIKINSLQEDQPAILNTSAGPTRTFAPRPEDLKQITPLPQVEADWTNYYANLDAVLQGKEELIVKPYQIRRVLYLIECAFKSAETGLSVPLNYSVPEGLKL